MPQPSNTLHVSPGYQPLFREVGLDAEAVFTHPAIRAWRRLADRENCTLDATLTDGRSIRLHVKRYTPVRGITPARQELNGHQLLQSGKIPTAPLVAWGELEDRRSFVLFEDLAGYEPADKLIERGVPFTPLLQPTADLAARLHQAGLHHRDLYLCHFMAKIAGDEIDVKLIDTARVRRLPGWLTRRRWVIKDLAQFWYSTLRLPITDEQRDAWLTRYGQQRGMSGVSSLRSSILRKVRQIARHDARLNQKQPTRNISIPTT